MATTCGQESPTLADAAPLPLQEVEQFLRDRPGRFDFFQAVRLLLRISTGRKPVGYFVDPGDEAVRFGAEASIAFPPNTINQVQWEGELARMTVTFMGLTGPAGVLPRCYSAFVADRIREKDGSLAGFLDLFNHRLISLFYRAWEKHRFGVVYEREGTDRVSKYLSCLIGMGTSGLENRLGIPDQRTFFYTGLFSLQTRSAIALEQLLADYFALPVEVEQFIGVWRPLDAGDQCLLDGEESVAAQLGVAAVAGDAVWDQQSRIRLKLGPLRAEQYLSFLPSGGAFGPLRELVRFFCGPELEVEAQLILEQSDVPQCDLGKDDPAGPRLGWFTWMRSGEAFDRSPGDTVLLLM
jgi:type VI secretion system protein ImpH